MKYFDQINEHLINVRSITQKHFKMVDNECIQVKNRLQRASERLNEQTFATESQGIKSGAQTGVMISADRAREDVAFEFDSIRGLLTKWIAEEPNSKFMNIVTFLSGTNTAISKTELEMLSELTSGSYFGQKVLSQMAMSQGFDVGFNDVDTISRSLETANADVLTMINAYQGNADVALTWINEKNPDSGNLNLSGIAMDYLEKPNSTLAAFEDLIKAATDTNVSLARTEQQIIAELFVGADTKEARLNRMINLLIGKPSLESRLATYDEKLYKNAKRMIMMDNLDIKITKDEAENKLRDERKAYMKDTKTDSSVQNNNAYRR